MLKSLLSNIGYGELPASFGFVIGERVELPFRWHWELHKGQRASDGSAVSIFICRWKDRSASQAAAAKHAEQMAKSLRHPNILRTIDSIFIEGAVFVVTEAVVPLLAAEAVDIADGEPAIWGLRQAMHALSFLHASGFTHGLFGPASIFVTQQGDYRLGGFDLCRRGNDGMELLAARRTTGQNIKGWPVPPEDKNVTARWVDLWGVALLIAYVFKSAYSGFRGIDPPLDLVGATEDIPAAFCKSYAQFQKPGPFAAKGPIEELLHSEVFEEHPAIKVMSFLDSLHDRTPEEKQSFFESLPEILDGIPRTMQTRQVLPELLVAQKYRVQEITWLLLPSIIKISVWLEDNEFKEEIAPLLTQLFAVPDRAIRFQLLTFLGDTINRFDLRTISDTIFPECEKGLTDSNEMIRKTTVRSIAFFVPHLKAKVVENRVIKCLLKMLQDPDNLVRMSVVVCCGRISSFVREPCAKQTLQAVFKSGLKDSFGRCRAASLHTLMGTASLFSTDELCTHLSAACQYLVDPEPVVADKAFEVVDAVRQQLRHRLKEQLPQSKETLVEDASVLDGTHYCGDDRHLHWFGSDGMMPAEAGNIKAS